VRECADYENVLMVGHNPNITAFLAQLIFGATAATIAGQQPRIRLRKGSIAKLSMGRGPGTLQWLMEPRMVRSLYANSTKSSRRKISRK
jgi:phosphohistidine phosphatase